MIGDWRLTYILTIPLRILLTFQPSYLHPDEQFQSFEPLAARLLGYHTHVPWEFSTVPSRSILPLLLEYPFVWLNTWLHFPPLTVYYLTRLMFCLVSWQVTDWCLYRIMPTKQERLKAIFFTSIGHATLCFQSHTFSNSIETPLVLLGLVVVENLRSSAEVADQLTTVQRAEARAANLKLCAWLGVVLGFGILNRTTFVAWFLLPSYWVLVYAFKCDWRAPLAVASASFATLLSGIAVDIWWWNRRLVTKILIPYLRQAWITKDPKFARSAFAKLYRAVVASPSVVPLVNNVAYNLKPENLALHGLHARYTHLLVNIPLMFGPLAVLIVWPKPYVRTTPFWSFVSGVAVLSVFPHQEFRFLLPAFPLGCCFIDLVSWSKTTPPSPAAQKDAAEKPAPQHKPSRFVPWLIRLTLVFNAVMALVMGKLHQGGVIPALEYLAERNKASNSISIWWRSYSPPAWLLGDTQLSIYSEADPDVRLVKFLNFMSDELPQNASAVVDVMGMDPDIFKFSLDGILRNSDIPRDTDVLIAAPCASFSNIMEPDGRFEFTKVFDHWSHLDLNHLDEFADFGTDALVPGFGIWKVQSTAGHATSSDKTV